MSRADREAPRTLPDGSVLFANATAATSTPLVTF